MHYAVILPPNNEKVHFFIIQYIGRYAYRIGCNFIKNYYNDFSFSIVLKSLVIRIIDESIIESSK